MKSETRRKIADTAAATLVVIMVVIALWLVRCSSQSAPVYYAPDTTAVYTSADTIPDSIRHPHKKEEKRKRSESAGQSNATSSTSISTVNRLML